MIATKWAKLMQYWEIVELNLTTFQNYKLKEARMLKLRVVAFILVFLALGNVTVLIQNLISVKMKPAILSDFS